MALSSLTVFGQNQPSITLHSENYDLYGDDVIITLALGSNIDGKIGVDCGYGIVQYDITPALYDSANGGMSATYVPCELSPYGNVYVYCYDGVTIDYFNGDGCGITNINFANPESIEILSLRHNSLLELDLSAMCNVASIDVGDNPFTYSPLIVGGNKPNLLILNIDIIDNMDQSFKLTDYPSLVSFDAFDNKSLYACDPSQCPNLAKLSIDETPVSELDVSQNPELIILNISGTDIPSIDVTNNTKLQQLFCSALTKRPLEERMSHIDISQCPDLVYFFCSNNALTEIDLTHNTLLRDISLGNNRLTHIDLSNNECLQNVSIDNNYFTFATLPSDPGWLEYFYRQKPIEVPRSYLVDTPIDFSEYVLRPGTTTWAVLYEYTPDGPLQYQELEDWAYTFEDGVLTITAVVDGEVFVEFYNSELAAYPMSTTQFKVKTPEEYGQNELAFTMAVPSLSNFSMSIGMEGASVANPKYFYVDFGDGELMEGVATTSMLPDAANFTSDKKVEGDIKVYVEEDGVVTALGYADAALSAIDLKRLRSLQYLSLKGTGLDAIDLSYNSDLYELTLTGNHFGDDFTLVGNRGYYNKNFLYYLDLSDNGLNKIELMLPEIISYLDLSNNNLTALNLTDAEQLVTLNVSHNALEYLRLSYQSSMKYFDGSYNRLSEVVLPETNVIEHFDISNNAFTFVNLPIPSDVDAMQYIYSPQALIDIPEMGMRCNLSEQYVTILGHKTEYSWIDGDGNKLILDIDYTIADGVTTFLEPVFGRSVYCEMTNAAFPDLALMTGSITPSGLPQYVIGEFTTVRGNQTANLSLGGAYEGCTIFIDWEGNGNVTEYLLKPTYTLFTAKTKAGARVKVYSYEQDSQLTIFSMSGVTLADVDLSGMKNLYCLSLTNAGIDHLVMPEAPELGELFFVNNKFTEFDFSAYPKINALSFEKNKFTNLDLSALPALEMVNFSNNKLQTVTFGDKPKLWAIHLSGNEIEEIDFSQVPMAYQITLDHNRLTHIDLDNLPELHVLYLDNNRFTFTTLPEPREQWSVYYYSNQAPLEVEAVNGVVDISSQSVIHGVPSMYTWLRGEPWIDTDTGELMGNLLVEGEDYTIQDGVTTFLVDVDNAVCIVSNELFPKAYLTTPELAVTAAGIADGVSSLPTVVKVRARDIEVVSQPYSNVTVYGVGGNIVAQSMTDASGMCIIHRLPQGLFVVKVGSDTSKVIVK